MIERIYFITGMALEVGLDRMVCLAPNLYFRCDSLDRMLCVTGGCITTSLLQLYNCLGTVSLPRLP